MRLGSLPRRERPRTSHSGSDGGRLLFILRRTRPSRRAALRRVRKRRHSPGADVGGGRRRVRTLRLAAAWRREVLQRVRQPGRRAPRPDARTARCAARTRGHGRDAGARRGHTAGSVPAPRARAVPACRGVAARPGSARRARTVPACRRGAARRARAGATSSVGALAARVVPSHRRGARTVSVRARLGTSRGGVGRGAARPVRAGRGPSRPIPARRRGVGRGAARTVLARAVLVRRVRGGSVGAVAPARDHGRRSATAPRPATVGAARGRRARDDRRARGEA